MRALERYDPARGVPFAAFATWWIRQSLQEARSDFIRPMRLPPKAIRQLSQLKSEHQRIYQDERRSAKIGELADRTNIEIAQAEALLTADARPRSLDEPIEKDGFKPELIWRAVVLSGIRKYCSEVLPTKWRGDNGLVAWAANDSERLQTALP